MNSDQHKATLNELHREIDRLKLQNKDQQWRLVLNGASSPTEVLQETVSYQKQHNPKVGCMIRRAIGKMHPTLATVQAQISSDRPKEI